MPLTTTVSCTPNLNLVATELSVVQTPRIVFLVINLAQLDPLVKEDSTAATIIVPTSCINHAHREVHVLEPFTVEKAEDVPGIHWIVNTHRRHMATVRTAITTVVMCVPSVTSRRVLNSKRSVPEAAASIANWPSRLIVTSTQKTKDAATAMFAKTN